MTPAQLVISRFGGPRPLSRLLDIHHTSVMRWAQPKPRGSGGLIPSSFHTRLLTIAVERGVELCTDELVHGTSEDN